MPLSIALRRWRKWCITACDVLRNKALRAESLCLDCEATELDVADAAASAGALKMSARQCRRRLYVHQEVSGALTCPSLHPAGFPESTARTHSLLARKDDILVPRVLLGE